MKKKKPPVDPAVSAAAAALGRKGGQNGTGKSKRRPDAHYVMLAKARRKAKAKRESEQRLRDKVADL